MTWSPSSPEAWARRGSILLIVAAYVAMAVLFTYPLVWHISTHHVGNEGGDAQVYIWNLWWIDEALTELHTDPFQTDVIFYPTGIGLSLHTLGFLQGVLFIPLKAAFGEVAGANLIVLWTFVASGIGTYALARYLGASSWGAFLAGVVFGFCPYRLARLAGHYDLLGTEWLPLYTLAFLKAFGTGENRRWYVLAAGAAAAACGYTALNYLVFLAVLSLLLVVWKIGDQSVTSSSIIGPSAGILVVALVLLCPLLSRVTEDLGSWTYTPYPGSDRYAANLLAYFTPGPRQNLLGDRLGLSFDRNLTETTVFTGYVVMAVSVLACFFRSLRYSHGSWMGAAGVFFLLSLGSRLKIGDWEAGVPLPFSLIERLPLLDHLRAPSRFSILVMLSLAVLLAGAWTLWTKRLSRTILRGFFTVAAVLILIVEYLAIPIPLFAAQVPAVYELIAREPGDFTVVEIPGIEQVPGRLMYHQTVHGKRILIGTAARVPQEKNDYFSGLHLIRPLVDLRKGKIRLSEQLLETERELAPKVARFLDLRYFVLERSFFKRGVLSFLTQVLPAEETLEDEHRVLLRVRQEELPPLPGSLDPGAPESRMYFESGWSSPEVEGGQSFRWANRIRSTILFRRPSPTVQDVVLAIAPLEGVDQGVESRLGGSRLGGARLQPGWNKIRWPLPSGPVDGVERLELRWSEIRRASQHDPRRLAARLGGLRFE